MKPTISIFIEYKKTAKIIQKFLKMNHKRTF